MLVSVFCRSHAVCQFFNIKGDDDDDDDDDDEKPPIGRESGQERDT